MLTLGSCAQIVVESLSHVGEKEPRSGSFEALGVQERLTFAGSTSLQEYFHSEDALESHKDAIWQEMVRRATDLEPSFQLNPGTPKPWPPPPPPNIPVRTWPGGRRPYFPPETVLHLAEYLHDLQDDS
jgi:hypothetical protein